MKRPMLLSILAWGLIILNVCFLLFVIYATLAIPSQREYFSSAKAIHYALRDMIPHIILLISGAMMLKGISWSQPIVLA